MSLDIRYYLAMLFLMMQYLPSSSLLTSNSVYSNCGC